MTIKSVGKSVARTLLHDAGGLWAARLWNRNVIRILMYHDFPSTPELQEGLTRQCLHINKHYNVVSLTDIGRHIREGTPLPPNALAVTVDDGNRDFFINGYPIFRTHEIPVTIFLVSGFIDQKLWLWWDKIIYLIENTRKTSFDVSICPTQKPQTFVLETPEQRRQAISTITETLKMKARNNEERLRFITDHLAKQLDVELPAVPPAPWAPMTWPEVQQVATHGMDIGAHTVTHPVLSNIQDPKELLFEIEHSKKRIEEELKRPVLHFCYPYGCKDDFNEEAVKIVNQCGFLTAVTAQHGVNTNKSNPAKLLRLSVDPFLPDYYFQERLAGLHTG